MGNLQTSRKPGNGKDNKSDDNNSSGGGNDQDARTVATTKKTGTTINVSRTQRTEDALRDQIDECNLRIAKYEKDIEKTKRQAHKYGKAFKAKKRAIDKKMAHNCVKRIKQMEKNVLFQNNVIDKLWTVKNALERTEGTNEYMRIMKGATAALARLTPDIDKAEKVLEDLTELIDEGREIEEAIAQPIGDDVDEDELDAELNRIGEEYDDGSAEKTKAKKTKETQKDTKMPEVPSHLMPKVPKEKPSREKEETDEEIWAQLEAEAA